MSEIILPRTKPFYLIWQHGRQNSETDDPNILVYTELLSGYTPCIIPCVGLWVWWMPLPWLGYIMWQTWRILYTQFRSQISWHEVNQKAKGKLPWQDQTHQISPLKGTRNSFKKRFERRETLLRAPEKQTGICEQPGEMTMWQGPEGGLEELRPVSPWLRPSKGLESNSPKELNSANNHVSLEEDSNLQMKPKPWVNTLISTLWL